VLRSATPEIVARARKPIDVRRLRLTRGLLPASEPSCKASMDDSTRMTHHLADVERAKYLWEEYRYRHDLI